MRTTLNGAIAYRVGSRLRHRRLASLAAGALVAISLTPALVLIAGARRTATLSERYAAAHPSEFDFEFTQGWGPPRTAEIEALPGVDRAIAISFMFGGLIPHDAEPDASPLDAFAFVGDLGLSAGDLQSGRLPDPSVPGEFVATSDWAALGPYQVGDQFTLVTMSAETAAVGGFENAPDGPTVDATLVGIYENSPVDTLNDPTFTALTVFGPALLDLGSIGIASSPGQINTALGVDRTELRRQIDSLPGGTSISITELEPVPTIITESIDTRAAGFAVLAAVVITAALIVLTQLLASEFRIADDDRVALNALGYTRAQAMLDPVGRAAPAALAGAALAGFVAWALSGLFPTGFGDVLEPSPGTRFDLLTHVVGAALAALVPLTLVALLSRRRMTPRRPERSLDWLARRGPTVAAGTATRLAFGRTRRSASTNTGLTGIAFALAVAVAALIIAASLTPLIGDRARWGERWDIGVGQGGEALPAGYSEALVASSLVESLTLFGVTEVVVGAESLPVVAFEAVKGSEPPEVLDGRLPAAPGEIAVNTPAARLFGVAPGGALRVSAPVGDFELAVVGVAVVPGIEGVEVGDPSVLVNLAGYHQLDPEGGLSVAGVFLADDAPPDAATRLSAEIGAREPLTYGSFDVPGRVRNLSQVSDMPAVVAAVVGGLAVISLGHLLVVALRRRRGDLAVLRVLGGRPGWVRRVVHWLATLLTVVAVALGTLGGTILGPLVFRPFPEQIGARPGARLPWAWLGLGTVALVIAANAVAAFAGRRRATDRALRPE